MADGILLNGAGAVLRDGLSGLAKRQQLIAGNIANMETPGYRARDVKFEAVLQRELSGEKPLPMLRTASMHVDGTGDQMFTTSPAQIDGSTGEEPRFATVERGGPFQADGTGVDVDYEMARLSETTIQYNAVAQLMASRISILRSAVTEGRR